MTTHQNMPGETSASHGHDQRVSVEQFLKERHGEFSRSAQRARWISSPDEHEEHPGQTLATRSHEVIQRWAKERNAVPATVPGTDRGDREGVLRFNFSGYGGDHLEAISWEQFFKTFDERDLIFLFQEHMKAGNQSNFFYLDGVESDDRSYASHSAHAYDTKAHSGEDTSGDKHGDKHSASSHGAHTSHEARGDHKL